MSFSSSFFAFMIDWNKNLMEIVVENRKDDKSILKSQGKNSMSESGIINAEKRMKVNIIPEIFLLPSLPFKFSVILPIHTTG
ncbi:putative conserved hypothetical protein [Methanothermobacter sp. MT-2]|nr:putative conserved hypothetical protein [Methanothermobacter sp. MT-2]